MSSSNVSSFDEIEAKLFELYQQNRQIDSSYKSFQDHFYSNLLARDLYLSSKNDLTREQVKLIFETIFTDAQRQEIISLVNDMSPEGRSWFGF